MEGHGWVEREEPGTRNEKLNVYSYIQKQGIPALGGVSLPQTRVVALWGEHAVQLGRSESVHLNHTHTCSALEPELISDKLVSPPFIGT